jgi:hypothetical protein
MVYVELPDEEEGLSAEEYDAAVIEAVNEARLLAESLAEEIESEDDFIAVASEYRDYHEDPESTLRMQQAGRLSAESSSWLLDSTRGYGDVTVVDSEHGQGSFILYYISRDDNSYRTVGMRQILLSRPDINPEEYIYGEDDLDYQVAVEMAENELHERAQQVYSLFLEAGATEAAMIDLIAEHSDDTTEGGLYHDITLFPYQGTYLFTMKVVPEIEEWLFYENREIGDFELIYTEAFGYHLVLFPGYGEPFSDLIADDRMRSRDHAEWLESLPRAEPVRRAAFILVHI